MISKKLQFHGRTYTVFYSGKIVGPSGKELKVHYDKDGYSKVSTGNGNVTVHRLVAMAFVPNPNNYNEIDHLDGNRKNPSADNLEWVSHAENIRRAAANGSYSGERNSHAILNKYEVIFIRLAHENGIKRKTLAKHFNVTKFAVSDIVTRRNWSHIA